MRDLTTSASYVWFHLPATSRAAQLRSSPSWSTTATFAPAFAKPFAIAAPMPLPPPVTTARAAKD